MLYSPPPPALAAVQAKVVMYLDAHHFSFPQPFGLQVANFQMTDGGPLSSIHPVGMALPGMVLIAHQFSQERTNTETVAILLHEDLHETVTGGADNFAALTPEQVLANEQATESTTRDLLPGLLRADFPRLAHIYSPFAPTGYAGLVKLERVASARACRCGWTTPAARSWRSAHFLQPATSRELLS